MKPENLLDAMQHISPDLIAEAKPLPKPAELRDTETAETVRIRNEEGSKPMKKITQHIMTGVSIAAAVAVCAGIGVFIAKNGRSGGLNEPSSASVTSDVNTGATATDIAPVTRNFLGGTGELHFDMLHEVVLGSDDEYWYILFDDGVYTIKKSSDTYLPLMNSETQTAYFTEKLGQAPSQFLTDASGNLYVTVHHDHTDEHPVNYTSELEVFRVTKDGQTESMGMLRFNSTDSKQYFGRINYIDIFGENNDTISFMGIASVVSNEGVRLHTCPSFKAEAKLTDGKFGTLEGSSIEFYDEAEAVSNTDRVNYAWKDNYSYYLNKAGDLVRTAPFSSQYPNEELVVAANPPIKDIAQEKGSDEMYSLRTDGTVIYKSDVEWSNPQSIWSKEDPHNRWCRTSDALAEYGLEDVGSQEPRLLAGVFDGKLWGGCNAVCLLIDTKTGICQYAYNPAYLTPDTGSAATAAESGTTAPETTETTASPYSENEEQAIRYAKYAFEEWVNIEAGKGGDMHQYARDKNLAAYLNYAAKDYSNAERLNLSESRVWLDVITIDKQTDTQSGDTYYFVTGAGKWEYNNMNGNGAFGQFTFVLKDLHSHVYELTEMTHFAMDSADMKFRWQYLYNGTEINVKPDPLFWEKPERYEPLLKAADLTPAETGTVKCPVDDFTKDRVRFCDSSYTPKVAQASDAMKAELYSALAKTGWELTADTADDGDCSSIFIYNGGENPYRMDFFGGNGQKPVVRVVYYETDRHPDTYFISEEAFGAVQNIITGKTVSNISDYLIQCSLNDVAYLNTIGVWQEKYPDITLPDESAPAVTTVVTTKAAMNAATATTTTMTTMAVQ